MKNIQLFNLLDKTLMDAAKKVKPLYYIEPINEKDQKKKFLEGKIKKPHFLYRDLEYNPQEVAQKLESIKIPCDELGAIFEQKKKEILIENIIIDNRGKEDIVRENTIKIYGHPNKKLVRYAENLLRKTPNVEIPKNISSNIVKDYLQQALYDNNLKDWTVELSNKKLTTTYSIGKKITVCKNRKFTEIEVERLKVHEIGVHALRAANGYEQPFKIFVIGLPGYLPTEEGLALYFEEKTGNTNKEIIRSYAGRVIAVDSVCQGLSFAQTFDRLKSYNFSNEQAWNLTVRAHRGGGFIKDHLYLEGYIKIKEFEKNKGDFDTLYIGKVGIEHLPLIRKLIKRGILKKAKHKPNFTWQNF